MILFRDLFYVIKGTFVAKGENLDAIGTFRRVAVDIVGVEVYESSGFARTGVTKKTEKSVLCRIIDKDLFEKVVLEGLLSLLSCK